MSENRGFGTLPCPKCGEQESQVLLYLEDCRTCRCSSCEEEFDLEEVRELLVKWGRVLARLDRLFAE